MIGVISKQQEAEVVAEFFELFKTAWEFYDPTRSYDVIISTRGGDVPSEQSRLLIIYSHEQTEYDSKQGINIGPIAGSASVQHRDWFCPIYRHISSVKGHGQSSMRLDGIQLPVGLIITEPSRTVVRIGFNLFEEVAHLLSVGQPSENASIPTLENHIAILRDLILNVGISITEIPPIPNGYRFIACLTHDIDFIRIRDHKFDHTVCGFIYRATLGTLLDVIKHRRTWKELYLNWKAVLSLPLVHLGFSPDFWFKFDRYMELEKNVDARSTFFFIPFKKRMGKKVAGNGVKRRAARYDVHDVPQVVKKLADNGFEVGVHGIDAWHDVSAASAEKQRISGISKRADAGIRMHWLCFDGNSFQVLDDAGFSYDSTFGYNNAVGYRAGTTQVFKPIGAKNLCELPLNIQDTALFNAKHMSLTKADAWQRSNELIEQVSIHGGALTILWHDRSLSPERLYEDFYIRLLDELHHQKVWLAKAQDVVDWFRMRRSAKFMTNGEIEISHYSEKNAALPDLIRRTYTGQRAAFVDEPISVCVG